VPGAFPWGTFTINVAGSIALCAFLAALAGSVGAHPLWRPFFAVGFCGTYTTFSSFENETLSLVSRDRLDLALVYVAASVVVGLGAGLLSLRAVEGTRTFHARLAALPPLVLAPVLAAIVAGGIALGRIGGLEPGPVALGCLAVIAGGVVGALARYVVGALAANALGSFFPWGTFIINVTGSFAIGLYEGFASRPAGAPPLLRLFYVTGICGGYTTFSTLAAETLALAREGGPKRAGANVVGSVVLGFLAVFAGRAVGRMLVGGNP
jgi:CrcB protein